MDFESGITILVDLGGRDKANTNKDEDAIDIVAIHGIGAHPDRTWTGRGPADKRVNWLKDPDMLPKAVPTARIMRFGYESTWFGSDKVEPKKTYVSDVAEMLLKQLELNRRNTTRPVIFVAHSYGGLVLMQALRSSFDNPDKWSNIFRSTAGLIFFGTPFRGRQGLSLEQIVEAVAKGKFAKDNPDLRIYPETMALSVEGNPYLQDIVDRFTATRRGDHPIPLWCFYETEPSAVGKTLGNADLKKEYLVPRQSACLDTSKGVERQSLERNHYNLQKFRGPEDAGYQAVEDAIVRLAKGARKYLTECSTALKKRPFLVPFGRNEAFVGRDAILDDLSTRLPPAANPDDCQRTALEGLGGIGKTQLALEAAYRVHDDHPDCSIFWVPAVNQDSLNNAYRAIGRELDVKGVDDDKANVQALVHAALARDDTGPWLWIIDNADDQELLFGKQGVLNDLPFSRNGSILVTTRNRQVALELDIHGPGLLKVEAMCRFESSKLLGQGLREDQIRDTPSTNALLDFLTDLPLAVKQASAYIAKQGMSTAVYLEHCQSSEETLIKLLSKGFNDRGRYKLEATSRNPVATTWLISFEHIARDVPLAADYLRFISFLSEKDIPKSLLPAGYNKLEADEAFGTLKAYAFINQRTDIGRFDIHRLVRLAMHNWLVDKGEQAAWLARVIKQLNNIYPDLKHENREVWIGYLPHARAALETRAKVADETTKSYLLTKVGESLGHLGKFAEAEAMHRKAFELRTKLLGDKHPYTLDGMHNLAFVLERLGRYNEAESMQRQAFELYTKVHGPEHPNTLNSMHSLACVLERLGRYNEAESMQRQAFKLYTKVHGPEHPNTLNSMYSLACVLERLGRYNEAESMQRQAFELYTKVCGPEHPDTLSSMNNLGFILGRLGRYNEAESMQRQAFELRTKVHGPEHPNTLNSIYSLACVLERLGRYNEAESIQRQAFELYTKVCGPEHPSTLASMHNLAFALDSYGKHREGVTLMEECLYLRTRVLGSSHPDTESSRNILSVWKERDCK
ncbi:hypothetical protein QBC43DRAFT_244760 [Cladorrhinum sp. PSN259]|nr:hypothetical protein QBC43DRAFT_244760 [Cladorrhinum sp. PSN259]